MPSAFSQAFSSPKPKIYSKNCEAFLACILRCNFGYKHISLTLVWCGWIKFSLEKKLLRIFRMIYYFTIAIPRIREAIIRTLRCKKSEGSVSCFTLNVWWFSSFTWSKIFNQHFRLLYIDCNLHPFSSKFRKM